MNNTFKTFAAAAVFAAALPSFAQAPAGGDASVPQGTKKLMLKISTVETSLTRHQKTWSPVPQPLETQEKPYTDADIMKATPEEASRMRLANEAAGMATRAHNAKVAYENWKAAADNMKGVQAKLEGTDYGRQIVLALDKFAGEAGTYFDPDCIEFFHRMDMDEGQQEQFMQDMSDPGMLAAPYFIKLIFDDPREESGVVSMNGQQVKMSKYMQTVTYEVQDLQGKMITSGNVKQEKQVRTSNAVQRSDNRANDQIAVLEDALVEVAKRINDRFVAKVSFTLVGPKKDEDFDENAGTIMVDGDGHSSGDEFTILKGPHIVEVEMDGYKRTGSSKLTITKSQDYKIPMVSSMCDVTVKIKGPAGDDEFDPDSATITLAGDEEFSPSNGEPEKVPQGKYTLTVEMDGYETFTKTVSLGSTKQDVPVAMKKAKNAE